MQKKKVWFFHTYDNGSSFRVWLDDSPGDVFDVVYPSDLIPTLRKYIRQGYLPMPGEPPSED